MNLLASSSLLAVLGVCMFIPGEKAALEIGSVPAAGFVVHGGGQRLKEVTGGF